MKMQFNIYAILLLMPVIALSSASGGYAAPFLELPPMASSVAFGNACITYDPEPAALFWNPANLDGLYKYSAQVSVERLPMSDMRYGAAGVFRWQRFRFAAGMLQHSAGEIQGRDDIGNPTSTLTYGYTAVGFGVSYGMDSDKKLKMCGTSLWKVSFGGSGEILMQKNGLVNAGDGYTLNIGFSSRYGVLRGGLLLRNAVGRMKWSDNSTSDMQAAVVAGIGLEFCESHWVEVSAEEKSIGRVRWRIGGQFLATDWAGFRAGIDFSTGTPAANDEMRIAGGGVIYYKIGIPLEISYSIQYIEAIRGFGLSSSFSWNTFD